MHLLKGFVFLAGEGSIWIDYQNFIVKEVVEAINEVPYYPQASEIGVIVDSARELILVDDFISITSIPTRSPSNMLEEL